MKDTLITSKFKKKALITYLICFSAAYILNVVGIILYKSPAIELISQLHVVLIISIVFYLAVFLLRTIYYAISKLWVIRKK